MFTEKEIQELEKLSEKNEAVKKLFEFWQQSVTDGKKAALLSINKKWLDISKEVETTIIKINGDDKTFKNFLDMTKLFGDIEKKEKVKKTENEHIESFTDKLADKHRK